MRDITLADTVYIAFTTRAFDTGIPTTLAGTPVVSAYENADLTQITAGITLGVDHDGVTGLNMLTIVATGANGFEADKDYTLVITTGTVSTVSVVGESVGEFSIQRAPVNWANVSDPTTAVVLSATEVLADITKISGDATAANNLESQYDTTGLTGDTFPSTQSQLAGIANVGAAINRTASAYSLTTGVQSSGTVASTAALDGTNHEHTDAAGVMDLYYEFNVASGIPTSATMTGYLNGVNDSVGVYGYDWVAAGWVQIGTLVGKGATTNDVNSYSLFTDMVGSGANTGLVRLRFFAAAGLTTATLAVDQIYCSFSQNSSGYDNGAIWIDTNLTNTNTVVGIDGTATNPVSTIAAANTLSAATNLTRFEVAPGSSITFAASQVGQLFRGGSWTLALGGQDISDSNFYGARVSGVATMPTGEAHFHDCELGACTLGEAYADGCGLGGAITLTTAGTYLFDRCHSAIAGAASPSIDFGAAVGNTSLNMRHYSGGIEISNKDAVGTDTMSLEGNGQLVVAASSSGAIAVRGNFKVTNTGGATITYDDNTANTALIVADTNELQGDWTDGGRLDLIIDAILADTSTDGVALSATTANQVADALLTRDWTSVTGEAARSALNALRLLRNKYSITGSTLTVTEEDDATTAWTAALTTDAAADPVTASDPA